MVISIMPTGSLPSFSSIWCTGYLMPWASINKYVLKPQNIENCSNYSKNIHEIHNYGWIQLMPCKLSNESARRALTAHKYARTPIHPELIMTWQILCPNYHVKQMININFPVYKIKAGKNYEWLLFDGHWGWLYAPNAEQTDKCALEIIGIFCEFFWKI